jgi:cold shock CspA family protein
MGDAAASTDLLERAWAKMPRGSGMAKRLARRHLVAKNPDAAIKVLTDAIERDPSDRSVNLLLANIMFEKSGDLNDIFGHRYLAQSFAHGDREYFSRFVASAVAFACRDFDRAYALADELERRAPSDFYPGLGRTERWLSEKLRDRTGTVASTFGAYVFIKMRDCPRDIYAPTSKSEDENWDKLVPQDEVLFDVEYSRKGPIAVNLRKLGK